jgi:transcriptional regulator with XRE-family HTH domain
MSKLGKSIQKRRKAAGLTQKKLAHAIGLKGSDAGAYISRVEAGKQEPRLATLRSLAKALKVSLTELTT